MLDRYDIRQSAPIAGSKFRGPQICKVAKKTYIYVEETTDFLLSFLRILRMYISENTLGLFDAFNDD